MSRKGEGQTDYERWKRERERTKSLCCDCLLNDGSCRLIKSFLTVSPCSLPLTLATHSFYSHIVGQS